jgi:N-acetylglucosamine-6-phosphate deacetylase
VTRTLVRGGVVSGGRRLDDAVVAVEGDRIAWVGAASDWPGADLPPPAPGRLVLPGLVDVHCHGAAGHGFPEADPDGLRAACDHHLRRGTTALLGSLVSAPLDVLERRVRALAPLVDEGRLAGVHLEGPFLAAARCGAQDPRALVPGDPVALRRLLDAGRGRVRSVTLAPETAHLRDLLALLADAEVVPSYGHTDASAADTTAAIAAAPERLSATHLFNGMPPLHHRAPGPVAACLAAAARGRMVVELIADGVHLADETVGAVFDLVGPGQIALVTDAMAAAGMADGRYPLGPLLVDVVDGVARLAELDGPGPGAIAGGTSRLVDVVRRVVRRAGVALPDAVTAATATPARLLGLDRELGAVEPGLRADLLLTDGDLVPEAVLRAGAWVDVAPPAPRPADALHRRREVT